MTRTDTIVERRQGTSVKCESEMIAGAVVLE